MLVISCDLLKVSDEPCLQQTLCLLLHLLEFFIQALDAQLITQVKKTKTKSNLPVNHLLHENQVLCDLLKSQMSYFMVWPRNTRRFPVLFLPWLLSWS